MSQLSTFQLFTRRLLWLIGWIIHQLSRIFIGDNVIKGINSPLFWLTIGLFFAFAALHIFKRILGKG